eukprot:gene6209-8553_t
MLTFTHIAIFIQIFLYVQDYCECAIRSPKAEKLYQLAVDALDLEDYHTSAKYLEQAVLEEPNDSDCNQLLGTILLAKIGDSPRSLKYLAKAYDLDGFNDAIIASNYMEALRFTGNAGQAKTVGDTTLKVLRMKNKQISYPSFYSNLGLIEAELGNYNRAMELYRTAISFDNKFFNGWKFLCELTLDHGTLIEGETLLRQALQIFPNDFHLTFALATAIHKQEKPELALEYYNLVVKMNPEFHQVYANMGAAYHTLGQSELALQYYKLALPHLPNDAGIRNNLGALLGTMNKKLEEIYWLEEAIKIDPKMEEALVNLGGYYQDEGFLEKAKDYLQRAMEVANEKSILSLRMLMLMTPVSSTWKQMCQERFIVQNNLHNLFNELASGRHPPIIKEHYQTTLDRIHFYIVYHGVNDRYFQELVVRAYEIHLKDTGIISSKLIVNGAHDLTQSIYNKFNPQSRTINNVALLQPRKKCRVGFLSKFLGLFEPHGLLLDGVMKYLPRSSFTVIGLPIARSDGKPISYRVVESVDEIHEISLIFSHAFNFISSLDLDILVFADVMSEPITHFLAHCRLAPLQLAFWGNPITSGSKYIDYFISADRMEHPFRTRMPIRDEPYTEQIVLLEGQGIWYYKPQSMEIELKKANLDKRVAPMVETTRADFGCRDDWFIYLLPQSVFKIHPLYDDILRRIVIAEPNSHLVVTGGRREHWTELYMQRLYDCFGKQYRDRIHLIERVSSERFNNLLEIADVILHPFPFDGSKTSADALFMTKPIVTLPTEYLRGRMGVSFLRTMNIPELVAKNTTDYINIAIELNRNKLFYNNIIHKINTSVDLIWEDLEYPYVWAKFLLSLTGRSAINDENNSELELSSFSFDKFVSSLSDRNKTIELDLQKKRVENREEFDEAWGNEEYMLYKDGVARLETFITNSDVHPRIFNDWKDGEFVDYDIFNPINNGSNGRNLPNNQLKTVHSIEISTQFMNNNNRYNNLDAQSIQSSASGSSITVSSSHLMQDLSAISIVSGENVLISYPSKLSPTILSTSVDNQHIIPPAFNSNNNRVSSAKDNIMLVSKHPSGSSNPRIRVSISDPKDLLRKDEDAIRKGEIVNKRFVSGGSDSHDGIKVLRNTNEQYAIPPAKVDEVSQSNYNNNNDDNKSINNSNNNSNNKKFAAVSSKINDASSVITIISPEDSIVLETARLSVSKGQLNNAYDIFKPYYDKYQTNPLYLLDLGSIQYFRGNYLQSYELCRRSLAYATMLGAENSSSLVYACIGVAGMYLSEADAQLPSLFNGGGFILMFSIVEWSLINQQFINEVFEPLLYNKGLLKRINFNSSNYLMNEIHKIQENYSHLISHGVECVNSYLSEHNPKFLDLIITNMMYVIDRNNNILSDNNNNNINNNNYNTNNNNNINNNNNNNKFVTLICQYYRVSENNQQKNIDLVLMKNLLNPMIEEIALLTEKEYDFKSFPNSFKIRQYVIGMRLTFKYAFLFANEYLVGKTVILANADIYFDHTLARLSNVSMNKKEISHNNDNINNNNNNNNSDEGHHSKTVFALLRWKDRLVPYNNTSNEVPDNQIILTLRADSQDAWIFRPPLDSSFIEQTDFALGLPRCDNHIAYLLSKFSYDVINPVFAIHAIELDTSNRGNHLYGTKDAVFGSVRDVLLSDRMVF